MMQDGTRKLTRRQRETLEFLERFIAANGYPPTVRQICAELGLSSTQTAFAHLARLEQKGFVRLSHAHRAIQLLAGSDRGSDRDSDRIDIEGEGALSTSWRNRDDTTRRLARGIPLVGRVAAGQPIFAVENIEGHVDLGSLRHGEGVFALRVKGDSMVEAGILDGDYILVRQQETAENGDIVVALLRDEATVKFFFREPRRIRLQPANRKMKPIYAKQVSIVGKVVASVRGYGPVSLVNGGE